MFCFPFPIGVIIQGLLIIVLGINFFTISVKMVTNVKFIIVTSPAMPSGNFICPDDLETIVKYNPKSFVFVDQAYYGFENDSIDVNAFIEKYDNVMFSRTFSKFFGLAGLRLGYGIASKRAMKALWLDLPLLRLPIIARRAVIESLRDNT